MNMTKAVILGACLIAAALIVGALPGLDDMRREHRIRQGCEAMICVNEGGVTSAFCSRLAIETKPCLSRIPTGWLRPVAAARAYI
jgi:hypothetical protein